jgi:hypothetical protein
MDFRWLLRRIDTEFCRASYYPLYIGSRLLLNVPEVSCGLWLCLRVPLPGHSYAALLSDPGGIPSAVTDRLRIHLTHRIHQ